ncbi:hypothetical protein ACTXMB_00560 [Arthrobacter rhombi]|uniref:hypothetical protein n=1 Tax=Micrococcaceae TaxID=1268 RepID=UPI000BB84CF2|nr:hypothetical protein [Glutamicibacter sp. BW78]PCC24889.1 hypothetical protein CIK75_12110 [Glutamicibacter sp. BW78]
MSAKTRTECERVLSGETEHARALAKSVAAFEVAWGDSPYLTPRQAYAIAMEVDGWGDMDIADWIQQPDRPLHQISPFDLFDLRVMMLVGESRAWAEAVRQRCYKLSDGIETGILPFDRPGPLIDEVLIGAALSGAQASLEEMPELFERIGPRESVDDEESEHYLIGDNDWDVVSDGFDDRCRWDEWEVPLRNGHPLLPAVLVDRHPFSWFDYIEASGPGYLQALAGRLAED